MTPNPFSPESSGYPPSYGAAPEPARGSRKQVERVLDMLYRRRALILAALVLAGAFAAFRAFTQQPVYETGAVVMLDLTRMPGGSDQQPQGDTPFVRNERNVSTELFILNNSRALAERVNTRLRALHEAGELETFPPTGGASFSSASRNISSAIRITATSPNPQEAAILANVYAEEYVRQTQDASRSYLVASREFLEAQEERRREELHAAEEAIEGYLRRTGAVGLSQEGAGLAARIAGIEAQRDGSVIDLQMREASLAELENQLNRISPQLAQHMASRTEANLARLNNEITTLEGQRREALDVLANDPGAALQTRRLADIERRISQLQAEYQQANETLVTEAMAVGGIPGSPAAVARAIELSQQISRERVAISGLRAQLGSMSQRLAQNQASLSQVPEQTTEVARLQRTRAHAEQMYQYVVQRLQETRISEESDPGYARILSRAGVPRIPTGNSPWRSLGMGLLFGLLLGVGLAVVRDRLDTRLYKPDQIRDLGVSVLGVIPNLAPFLKERYGKADRAEHEGVEVSTSLLALLEPLSAPSEAYRHLRTSVQFSRPDDVVQTIVVTSSAAGDGKSTTAANLAVSMAQAHRRTLLIDADLRRPVQHGLFGCADTPGLATLLEGKGGAPGGESLDADSLAAWLERFRSPTHKNLYVLPAGALSGGAPESNPSELLGSRRMREVLDAIRQRFDVVLIDTPPVLAATDAVLLSTQADATIVVVRAGATKEGDLEYGLEMLRDVGARIAGVLLNGFDITQAYGYRYSYGHYSKYGPYTKQGYDTPARRAS